MSAWFPDDQHGYSIALCRCKDGPYLGARQMGTPCCCERCRRMTQEQFDYLVGEIEARALIRAARFIEYDMAKAWGGTTAWFSTGNKVADVVADVLRERAEEARLALTPPEATS